MDRLPKHQKIIDDYEGYKKIHLKTHNKKVLDIKEKINILKDKKYKINFKNILK